LRDQRRRLHFDRVARFGGLARADYYAILQQGRSLINPRARPAIATPVYEKVTR
jgi:hypothetical protein